MSQSSTPPAGPPVDNPYAGQPGQPPAPQQDAAKSGLPQQGAPQPGFPTAPVAPAAPVRDNLGLGLAAAVGAAVVAAGVYGAIIGLTKHEIGWAAVGVGFLMASPRAVSAAATRSCRSSAWSCPSARSTSAI